MQENISFENPEENLYHFEVGNLLVRGNSKFVYDHPFNKDEVRCVFKAKGKTQEDFEGSYYLTNLLNLLFPKNIPKMPSFKFTNGISEWVFVDRQKIFIDNNKSKNVNRTLPEWKELNQKVGELGVTLDTGNNDNFDFDTDGNFWYLDSIDAWGYHGKDTVIGNFNTDAISEKIKQLSEPERHMALSVLNELQILLKQEQLNITAQNVDLQQSDLSEITEYMKILHLNYTERYHDNCLEIAQEIALRLIKRGQKPEILCIKGANKNCKSIDDNIVEPRVFGGEEQWEHHMICVNNGVVYDPMVGKPIELQEYLNSQFEKPVIAEVEIPYKKLLK